MKIQPLHLLLALALPLASIEPYIGAPRFARAVALKGWVQVTDFSDSATFDVDRNEPLAEGDFITLADNGRLHLALPGGGRLIVAGPAKLELARLGSRGPATLRLLRGELLVEIGEGRELKIGSDYGSVAVGADSRVLLFAGSNGIDVSVIHGGARAETADKPVALIAGESLNLSAPKVIPVDPNYKLDAGNLRGWADGGRKSRKPDPNAARAAAWLRQNLPEDLADSLSELDEWGRWQLLPDYGWVWHPDEGRDWMPFTRGQWRYTPWGLFWVADEPWGWLPYRYGVWRYRVDVGWFWIPDERYGGAWVVFVEQEDAVGWCPGYAQNEGWAPTSAFCNAAPRADFYSASLSVSHRDLASFSLPVQNAAADAAPDVAASGAGRPRGGKRRSETVMTPPVFTRRLQLQPAKPGPQRKTGKGEPAKGEE